MDLLSVFVNKDVALRLNFLSCQCISMRTTPAYSPQWDGRSNGIIFLFASLRIGCCEDHNENPFHKWLKIMTPREFIRVANGHFLGGFSRGEGYLTAKVSWLR